MTDLLSYHVTGAIERGQSEAITEAPSPHVAAALAMAEAFSSKQDIYYSGLRAYQDAGGNTDDYLSRYTQILTDAANIAIQS